MIRPLSTAHRFAAALFVAASAEAAPGGEWQAGVDTILEASAAPRGSIGRSRTLQGLVLGHAEWRRSSTGIDPTSVRAYASTLTLAGKGPTGQMLGDWLAASNIEGHPGTRLYSWWLDIKRGPWSLRAGALLADEEFAGTEGGASFVNSAFGWPAFISACTVNTGPAFYAAGLGLRLERTMGDTAIWRAGVFDGDTFDSTDGDDAINRHGWHYRLGGAQGLFAITEFEIAPGAGETHLKLGAWLHTADFSDVRDDASGHPFVLTGGAPRQHARNYGGYLAAERTLAGKTGEAGNLEAFVRAGLSPNDRNPLSWALDAGFVLNGPWARRPKDTLAVGIAHARFGGPFAETARQTAPSSSAPDFEQVFEVSHDFVLSDTWSVQPDLQLIRHPRGSPDRRDAFALFVRLKSTF